MLIPCSASGLSSACKAPAWLRQAKSRLVANHSLVLAAYISRANAAVLDLRIVLQQG